MPLEIHSLGLLARASGRLRAIWPSYGGRVGDSSGQRGDRFPPLAGWPHRAGECRLLASIRLGHARRHRARHPRGQAFGDSDRRCGRKGTPAPVHQGERRRGAGLRRRSRRFRFLRRSPHRTRSRQETSALATSKTVDGVSLKKTVTVEMYKRYPRMALFRTEYTNIGSSALRIETCYEVTWRLDQRTGS